MACLFCGTNVSKGTCKKKRKFIFGKSSSDALNVLDSLCKEQYGKKFTDFKGALGDQFSCSKCISRFQEYPELLQRVTDVRNDILAFIKNSKGFPEATSYIHRLIDHESSTSSNLHHSGSKDSVFPQSTATTLTSSPASHQSTARSTTLTSSPASRQSTATTLTSLPASSLGKRQRVSSAIRVAASHLH